MFRHSATQGIDALSNVRVPRRWNVPGVATVRARIEFEYSGRDVYERDWEGGPPDLSYWSQRFPDDEIVSVEVWCGVGGPSAWECPHECDLPPGHDGPHSVTFTWDAS